MASASPLRILLGAALLLTGGCAGDAFQAPEYCAEDCPLPPTQPPVVTWLFPAPGSTVGLGSDMVVKVTDDLRVDHVEFFYSNLSTKLHPGVIGAAPWHAELGKYYTDFPCAATAITLYAVAWDVEGNADTALTSVNWPGRPGDPGCPP